MNNLKQHWYLVLLAIFTGVMGVIVFLTSQKLKQQEPVAPTVPQEAPEAATCNSYTSQSSCNAAGCTGGFECRWSSQLGECNKSETRCAAPTPRTQGFEGEGAGDYCSGTSCNVGSAFSSSCYVNHYVSKQNDDPTVTDPVKTGVQSSSLGYQSCGAEQIDVTCGGKSDSVSRRYSQDCTTATATPKTQVSATPTPTPRVTSTPTPTPTGTTTPTPTTSTTPTPTISGSPTPTPSVSITPTPTTATTPTPTPQTPNVPIAGSGPSLWGTFVITGGILLLLLGLVF